MVNSRAGIYLTDFVGSTFGGEIAKNRDFCAEVTLTCRRVYHSRLNYDPALHIRSQPFHPGAAFGNLDFWKRQTAFLPRDREPCAGEDVFSRGRGINLL